MELISLQLFISKWNSPSFMLRNFQPDDFDVWVFEHHPLAVQAVDPQDCGELLENQGSEGSGSFNCLKTQKAETLLKVLTL